MRGLFAIGSLSLLLAAAHAAGHAPPQAQAQTQPQTLALWPGGAPGSELRAREPEKVRLNEGGEHIVSNVHAPSLTVFLPARRGATHTALIVVPGGGHRELWMDHEGYAVAEFLADHGIAAFVLKYRLAREPGSTYTIEDDELADLQRAIRLVRSRSMQWQLDPQHIGVIGFSAGGTLAALSGARYDDGAPQAVDPIERVSSRPAFQALLYSSMPQGVTYSADTPPAFLLCGAADDPGISQGMAQLYLALRRAGAHAELHIYDGVGHGFGIRPGTAGPVAEWPQRFLEWLQRQGLADRH